LEFVRGKEYYAHLSIGPGIKFYQALCKTSKIFKYELRIPDTYHVEMETLLCFDTKKGYLTRTEQMTLPEYQHMLLTEAAKYCNQYQNNDKMLDMPAYIIRKRTSFSNYSIKGVF